MKFKTKLMRLIDDHIYFKRTAEDTADRIIELIESFIGIKRWTVWRRKKKK